MIIIGSRSGGFDYRVQLPTGQMISLEPTEKSDLDVLLDSPTETPPKGAEVWGRAGEVTAGRWRGLSYPFKDGDGKLYLPESFDYLSRTLFKRFHYYGCRLNDRRYNGAKLIVRDLAGKRCGEFVYRSPFGPGRRL